MEYTPEDRLERCSPAGLQFHSGGARGGFLSISGNILLTAISAAHIGAAFSALRDIDDMKDCHRSWKKEVQK